MNHTIITGPYYKLDGREWRQEWATVALFDDLDIAHHVVIDSAVYCWIIAHMNALITAGVVRCRPNGIHIGSILFDLTSPKE